MIVEKKDFYTYILFSKNDSKNDLKREIDLILPSLDNLIIDIQIKNINKEELVLYFLKYFSFWKKKNKSFIFVLNDSNIHFSKKIICLPTLNEAIDYLYMEELERNV